MLKMRSGIITLSLLLLLSSGLFSLMLLNDDMLRIYSAQTSQRLIYVKQSLALQQLSQQQKQQACQDLDTNLNQQVFRFTFSLPNTDFAHYIWCQKMSLFKNRPSKAQYARQFEEFIEQANIEQFNAKFNRTSTQNNSHFYWFEETEQEWELNQNVRALVIAEGDLTIKGKGRVNGTVITGGDLRLEKGVQVRYNKDVVSYWLSQLSLWQMAEKSWYDFNPL